MEWPTSNFSLQNYSWIGNCEEELPKKPVGRQSTDRLRKKKSENWEKTLRFVLTFHGQATDKLPTGYRHITNSRPTVGRQVAYISGKTCQPSVGRLSADSWPTGFLGSSSSQLPLNQTWLCPSIWIFNISLWATPWAFKVLKIDSFKFQPFFPRQKLPWNALPKHNFWIE